MLKEHRGKNVLRHTTTDDPIITALEIVVTSRQDGVYLQASGHAHRGTEMCSVGTARVRSLQPRNRRKIPRQFDVTPRALDPAAPLVDQVKCCVRLGRIGGHASFQKE